jgi:hypothetical protein
MAYFRENKQLNPNCVRLASCKILGLPVYSVEMLGVQCTLDTTLPHPHPPKKKNVKKYKSATLKFESSIH